MAAYFSNQIVEEVIRVLYSATLCIVLLGPAIKLWWGDEMQKINGGAGEGTIVREGLWSLWSLIRIV